MHFFHQQVGVEALEGKELVLQVVKSQLYLFYGCPLDVEIPLLSRVLVTDPPMKTIHLNLIPNRDQLIYLCHEVCMIEALEGANMLIHSLTLLLDLSEEKLQEIKGSRFRVCLSIANLVMRD
jgi:hypothetical protein